MSAQHDLPVVVCLSSSWCTFVAQNIPSYLYPLKNLIWNYLAFSEGQKWSVLVQQAERQNLLAILQLVTVHARSLQCQRS